MGLVAFDFDGTLSDDEMIVDLGGRAGRKAEITAITDRAMAGDLSYGESLRQRASQLAGIPATEAELVYEAVSLRDGAAELLRSLDDAGIRVVVLSGGFEPGIAGALERADCAVDRIVANQLPTADGCLTGEVVGPLVDGSKADVLRSVASEFDVPLEKTIAVGDGANDLPMLRIAGRSVGFQPKPAIEAHCDRIVDSMAALREVLLSDLEAVDPD